jgi:hypothetical protein
MMKRLALVTAIFGILSSTTIALSEEMPAMTVWKTPWCGCCSKWVEHMRGAGFNVEVKEVENLSVIKRMAGIPDPLQSCHTARIDKYTVEGHVPAEDVKRLLKERPEAVGLAVPGMPSGSPGMENGMNDPYDVLLLKPSGKTEVYKSYQ